LVLVLPPLAPPPPPPVLPYTTLFRSRSRRSSAPRRSPRRACHRSTSTGSSPRHVPLGLQPPSPAPWHVAPVSVGEEPQRVHLQRREQGMSGNLASRGMADQALAEEPVRLRRGFSIALTERAAVANASSSGPAPRTARELVGTTDLVAPAKTAATSCGPAPWAPRPGASSGPRTPARSTPSWSTASPVVAPTTRPTGPSSAPSSTSAALASAAAAAMLAATDTPSLPRACCTAAPSGLEVRVSRNTPRRFSRATSMAPVREPAPRYGDRVTASPASGEPSV